MPREIEGDIFNELGQDQPFSILGLDPTQRIPGSDDLDTRRRLLMEYLTINLQHDKRVPLTVERINRAHNLLRGHWYQFITTIAQRYRQRLYWNPNSPAPLDFVTLCRPYLYSGNRAHEPHTCAQAAVVPLAYCINFYLNSATLAHEGTEYIFISSCRSHKIDPREKIPGYRARLSCQLFIFCLH